MPPFFTDDDWRTVSEFEAILRYTSQLILVCQNEEKLNVSHGPVMQKSLHDSLLKETMELISTEQRSSDKHMTCPTRSEVNVNSFAEAGKACKREHFLNSKEDFSIINQKQLLLMLNVIFACTYQIGKDLY